MDLLAIQGTLKSLLQHHSSKASIFRRSAFFTVQLSHPYMTTGKTIALIRQTFVGNLMSLLFNILSRLVIAFLPKEQASFNFMAVVTICSDFGAQKNKVSDCFHRFSIYFAIKIPKLVLCNISFVLIRRKYIHACMKYKIGIVQFLFLHTC